MEYEIRALVVDDNPVNVLAAKNLMSQFSIQLAQASSGLEALQYVKRNTVDLIIMDLVMPGLSGLETVQRIRTQMINGNQIKIVATSGQKIDNLSLFLKENLIDDYLRKPLDVHRVERCLKQWFILNKNVRSELDLKMQDEDWRMLEEHFGAIKHLDLNKAKQTTGGCSDYFIRIVRSSILQLKESGILYHTILSQFTAKKAHQFLHALKSVLYYLCATKLAVCAERLDEAFLLDEDDLLHCNRIIQSLQELQQFIQSITMLSNELEQAMNAYNSSVNKSLSVYQSQQYSKIELCSQIESIISCACRFEYIEILKGLNQLSEILPPTYMEYMEIAKRAMDEFDYETVKKALVICLNDMKLLQET